MHHKMQLSFSLPAGTTTEEQIHEERKKQKSPNLLEMKEMTSKALVLLEDRSARHHAAPALPSPHGGRVKAAPRGGNVLERVGVPPPAPPIRAFAGRGGRPFSRPRPAAARPEGCPPGSSGAVAVCGINSNG